MKNIFMRFEGGDTKIESETRDGKHPNWLEIASWSHALKQPRSATASTAGGHTAERCNHADMEFVKEIDSSSPSLWLACSQGDTFNKVNIEFYRASGNESLRYLEIVLNNAIVSSVMTYVESEGIPHERFSLQYASVKWIYTTQGIDGKKCANNPQVWSLSKNKASEAV